MNPVVYIDIYQGRKLLRQAWRWRALNASNHRVMGASGEAYTNKADCELAVQQLFGGHTNVYLRETEQGNQVLRMAISD